MDLFNSNDFTISPRGMHPFIPPNQITIRSDKPLGTGSFGTVYLGTCYYETVAIKILNEPPEATPDQYGSNSANFKDIGQDLGREVEILKQLSHGNVIGFRGICLELGCIVMEYCEKGSLYDVIKKTKYRQELTWERRLKIAAGAAQGMGFLHCRTPSVLHLDLKSPNLLLTNNWVVKVSDFGVSKFMDSADCAPQVTNPMWLAPEVLKGEKPDIKADVYPFGIIMWELLTLKEPWTPLDDDCPPELWAIQYQVVINNARPEIPDDFETLHGGNCKVLSEYVNLMKRCWDEDTSNRPSFGTIVNELWVMTGKVSAAKKMPSPRVNPHKLQQQPPKSAGKQKNEPFSNGNPGSQQRHCTQRILPPESHSTKSSPSSVPENTAEPSHVRMEQRPAGWGQHLIQNICRTLCCCRSSSPPKESPKKEDIQSSYSEHLSVGWSPFQVPPAPSPKECVPGQSLFQSPPELSPFAWGPPTSSLAGAAAPRSTAAALQGAESSGSLSALSSMQSIQDRCAPVLGGGRFFQGIMTKSFEDSDSSLLDDLVREGMAERSKTRDRHLPLEDFNISQPTPFANGPPNPEQLPQFSEGIEGAGNPTSPSLIQEPIPLIGDLRPRDFLGALAPRIGHKLVPVNPTVRSKPRRTFLMVNKDLPSPETWEFIRKYVQHNVKSNKARDDAWNEILMVARANVTVPSRKSWQHFQAVFFDTPNMSFRMSRHWITLKPHMLKEVVPILQD